MKTQQRNLAAVLALRTITGHPFKTWVQLSDGTYGIWSSRSQLAPALVQHSNAEVDFLPNHRHVVTVDHHAHEIVHETGAAHKL